MLRTKAAVSLFIFAALTVFIITANQKLSFSRVQQHINLYSTQQMTISPHLPREYIKIVPVTAE